MWQNTLPNGTSPHDVSVWWDGGGRDRFSGNVHTAVGLVAGDKIFDGIAQTFGANDDVSVKIRFSKVLPLFFPLFLYSATATNVKRVIRKTTASTVPKISFKSIQTPIYEKFYIL